jgi:hypothetical protein
MLEFDTCFRLGELPVGRGVVGNSIILRLENGVSEYN